MGREIRDHVEIVQINDYIESINQYTAGAFDGVTATNMDTLSIPSGRASTPPR
jgi:NitT/TauT family transport system substrate-binding protein